MGNSWMDTFNPNIPTAYTEALSYIEQLEIVYKKMRRVLEQVRDLNKKFDNYDKKIDKLDKTLYTKIYETLLANLNKQIADLQEEQERLASEIMASIKKWQDDTGASYTGEILQLREDLQTEAGQRIIGDNKTHIYVDTVANALQNNVAKANRDILEVANTVAQLNTEFVKFKMHLDNQFASLARKLEDKINEQIARAQGDMMLVSSPTTGKQVTLKQALTELLEVRTPYPITFEEYNKMGITRDDYDVRQIPYYKYNAWGGILFLGEVHVHPYVDALWCALATMQDVDDRQSRYLFEPVHISPVNGQPSTIVDIGQQIFNYIQEVSEAGVSMAMYEAKQLTMDAYDKLSTQHNFTVERYSLHARYLL